MNEDDLTWLSKWVVGQHEVKVSTAGLVQIGTYDNPGWFMNINLKNTVYEKLDFSNIEVDRTETDWVYCYVRNEKFEGFCNVLNLYKFWSNFKVQYCKHIFS